MSANRPAHTKPMFITKNNVLTQSGKSGAIEANCASNNAEITISAAKPKNQRWARSSLNKIRAAMGGKNDHKIKALPPMNPPITHIRSVGSSMIMSSWLHCIHILFLDVVNCKKLITVTKLYVQGIIAERYCPTKAYTAPMNPVTGISSKGTQTRMLF